MPQAQAVPVLDIAHLERMTVGDSALASEILSLFAEQAVALVAELAAHPATSNAVAHKLKGSARAVGAVALNEALDRYEQVVAESADRTGAIAELERCVAEIGPAVQAYLEKSPRRSAQNARSAGVGRNEPL